MEKSATLNLRVNPAVKHDAEIILQRLGLSMSAAMEIYLRQIVLRGGIPFEIVLPDMPKSVNADKMSDEELQQKLIHGFSQIEEGKTLLAADAFAEFYKNHK